MRIQRLSCLLLALLLLPLLSACGAKPLPEGFSETVVLETAEGVVERLSQRDFETVAAQFSSEMAAKLDAAGLESALGAALSALGDFEAFQSEALSGGGDSTVGEYAVAVLVCRYENGRATYTISVDADGLICGLYMK